MYHNLQTVSMNFKILSGSAIKIIAAVSMICDHVAKHILVHYDFAKVPAFVFHGRGVNLLFLMSSVIGRLAFPLFAFLAVEGYIHTRDLRRYVINLLIFAVLTAIPWNLLRGGLFTFHSLNVLFTFVLGIAAIYGIDRQKGWKSFFFVTMALLLAHLLKTDYGIPGVLLMVLLFEFRDKRECQSLSIIACLFKGLRNPGTPLAVLPVMMYNGKRGFIRGTSAKYLFYSIYPLHLLIIHFVRVALGLA